MVFASPIFLFLFLPVFMAAYYLTPHRWRSVAILLGSSVFYAWWRVDFVALLYGIIIWSWLLAIGIEKWHDTPRGKQLLVLGIVSNLAALGYFKYWNFGVASFYAMFYEAGTKPPPGLADVLLPIGISFFVFHAISYIVDVWRKDSPATRNLADFAAFIMLFPHLIAGPVLRYKDLVFQFKNRTHSVALFAEGAQRFMAGFVKKVLIADTVAPLADAAFQLENPTMVDSWLGIAAYTVQLYFDFSGYSEMAVGLALMMGFRFIENFNFPYISTSITEFWRRWHISLSTWLRDYLYIPLGGNKKGAVRTYVNLFLTMLLGGLWHGANWTYLAWGAWHGGLLAIERRKSEIEKRKAKGSNIVRGAAYLFSAHVYCVLAAVIGWVLFRSHSITYAFNFYQSMLGMNDVPLSDELAWQIKDIALVALAAGIGVIFAQPYFTKLRKPVELSKGSFAMRVSAPLWFQIVTAVFFLIAVSRLIAMSYSPFLYFQF